MAERSRIEWTDSTWNPGRSGTKVSPGCKHCCAEAFVERFRDVKGHPYEQEFRNSSALGKMERRFRQRRCVYRDALQFAHRPQRRIPKAQLKEANVLELSVNVEAALAVTSLLLYAVTSSRPRVRRKEPDGQIARRPQAGRRIQNHGDRIHDHRSRRNVPMRPPTNHQADVRLPRERNRTRPLLRTHLPPP